MPHVVDRHHLHHIDLAVIIAAVWGSLAVAVAIYDIGRWLSAW